MSESRGRDTVNGIPATFGRAEAAIGIEGLRTESGGQRQKAFKNPLRLRACLYVGSQMPHRCRHLLTIGDLEKALLLRQPHQE